jgi:catechol 2,3-dioxygenase-like lactoylglutathione lyase family enzyme
VSPDDKGDTVDDQESGSAAALERPSATGTRRLIVERTDFVSVPVTNVKRATGFYRDTLGLEQISKHGFPEFQLGENISLYLVNLEALGSKFSAPHSAHLALRVPDVAESRRELESRGVAFEGDTLDSGVCHMAFFRDPDGNQLMLHRRYAPPHHLLHPGDRADHNAKPEATERA